MSDAAVTLSQTQREHYLRNEAAKRANSNPLPGPAGDAFGKNGPIKVGDSFLIREVVASDWKVMAAIDSPIIRLLMEIRQNPEKPNMAITAEEEAEIAFQFTRTPKECREVIKSGKEAFREKALEEIADKVDAVTISLMVAAVIEQVKRSFNTGISYREKMEKEGEVRFFLDSPETNPETGSAGG